MTKKRKRTRTERRRRIAEELLNETPPDELVSLIVQEFKVARRTAELEIGACAQTLQYVLEVGIDRPAWKGTAVGDRLAGRASAESKESKRILASAVVDFLRERKEMNTLLLGTGSTAYEIGARIVDRASPLEITDIYTSNTLVLNAFARRKPPNMALHMIGGTLDRETAWLGGQKASNI